MSTQNKKDPFISVLIPCRNEENYIENVLINIIEQDYPKDSIEVIFIDGESNDKTSQIIKGYISKNHFIKILTNRKKTVPHALNMGIKIAKGDYIIRMDAHSRYPNDYLTKLIYWIEQLKADNVGGVWETRPSSNKLIAKSIAKVLSHPFGVGNAYFRVGIREPKEVDTVPFGCYRKTIFNKIGLFDEDLIRNQDDEFNGRLKKCGGKIYLLPDIKIIYYARESLDKLALMYYQYGYFKPLVNLKLGLPTNFRQFTPLILILSLFITFLMSFVHTICIWMFLSILFIYILFVFFFSVQIALKDKKNLILFLPVSFILTHFSYGIGYIKGIIDFYILKKYLRNTTKEISLSR